MNFRIVPRGAMGWLQIGLWLALAAMLVSWFVSHASKPPFARGAVFEDVVFLFIFGMVVWVIAGLWWMRTHAEEVDIVVHLRDRQRARRRGRRDDGGNGGGYGADGGYSDSGSDGGGDGGD
jgi:uncharacterized membrane protein YgcG